MMVEDGNIEVLKLLSSTSSKIAQGEVYKSFSFKSFLFSIIILIILSAILLNANGSFELEGFSFIP